MAIVKSGKCHTISDKHFTSTPVKTIAAIENLILPLLKKETSWKSVWIDPAVNGLILPLQTRKQSEGLLNLARGSRWPISSSTVRLFVYWKEKNLRTDLDLAILKLNENGEYLERIGWNSAFSSDDFSFSGDVTSSPHGAAEFMDCRVQKIDAPYILASIKKFCGDKFSDLASCYAGWMERENVGADRKQFDIQTVVQKVNVNREGNTWIPFIFDTAKKEIVYTDLYLSGSRCVENDKHLGQMMKAIINFIDCKPTYQQLLKLFCRANGISQVEETLAEFKIGLNDNCNLNLLKLIGEDILTLGQK